MLGVTTQKKMKMKTENKKIPLEKFHTELEIKEK